MAGLRLNRNQLPAEVDHVPEDLEREMRAWVRAWPEVSAAIAEFKQKIMGFQQRNRELNHKAGRRQSDRNLSREQKEALADLIARTGAIDEALDRLL